MLYTKHILIKSLILSRNFEFEDNNDRGIINNIQSINSSFVSIIKDKQRRKYSLLLFLAAMNKHIIKGMATRSAWNNHLESIPLDHVEFVGYAFQIEMKFTAWKYKFNIIEVPVIFTDRTEGESKMSGGIFFEAVFGVLQMKIKSVFRKFNRR